MALHNREHAPIVLKTIGQCEGFTIQTYAEHQKDTEVQPQQTQKRKSDPQQSPMISNGAATEPPAR